MDTDKERHLFRDLHTKSERKTHMHRKCQRSRQEWQRSFDRETHKTTEKGKRQKRENVTHAQKTRCRQR